MVTGFDRRFSCIPVTTSSPDWQDCTTALPRTSTPPTSYPANHSKYPLLTPTHLQPSTEWEYCSYMSEFAFFANAFSDYGGCPAIMEAIPALSDHNPYAPSGATPGSVVNSAQCPAVNEDLMAEAATCAEVWRRGQEAGCEAVLYLKESLGCAARGVAV